MDHEIKGMFIELEYLLLMIEDARKMNWEVTTEGPVEIDHEHCLICTDIINRQDQEHKARSILVSNIRTFDEPGNKIIRHSNAFLCWYCYERFIKNDGSEELRRLQGEERE